MSANEEFCSLGEIELCYESFGNPTDPTILLVMGLGAQMIAWPDEFCEQLAGRGNRVVRFDNRDCGRSTHLSEVPPPNPLAILSRRPKPVAYTLTEMAGDAVGLLDHLEVKAAHLVGASMGGMIAQLVAAREPSRVLTLTSVMSNTGARISGQPRARMWPLLLRNPATDRDSYVERVMRICAAIASPAFAADEAELRAFAGRSFDRGFDEDATMRQLGAVVATGDRTAELRRIAAPTLVIHGTDDPLVKVSGGRATARAIPNARLMLIEGMGHDLPRELLPRVVDAICAHAREATSPPVLATTA